MTAPRSQISRADRNVALLVAGCFFMEMLDGTIVVTSAPTLGRALGVSVGSIGLVVTAYLVTLAVLIPLSGWVAARIGGRATFLGAITIFTLASVGCALSTSLAELVVMRVIQGAGGAMMVPVGRLVVLARIEKANLMRITAYLVWPGLISPVLAPLAGGLITTYASWHWLFMINLPLGIIAFAIGWRIIHPPPLDKPGRLDFTGLALTGVGLGGLTFTANLLASPRIDWALAGIVGIGSAVLFAAAIVHLRRTPLPLVDLVPLRIHTFRSALTGTGFYFTAINSVPFLTPLMFEEAFHWSAVKSGSLVLFIFAGNIGSKPSTTYLYGHFGFKRVLLAATLTMAATMTLLGLTTAGTPLVLIALLLLVNGSARSIGATGYTTVIFSDVPNEQMRHASTLQTTVQQLAVGCGVAFGAIALRIGHPLGTVFNSTRHTEYTVALMLMACLSLLAALEASRMHSGSGDALRGRHARATPATEPAT